MIKNWPASNKRFSPIILPTYTLYILRKNDENDENFANFKIYQLGNLDSNIWVGSIVIRDLYATRK